MILVTHAVVGAGLSAVSRANPLFGFGIGFVSHFLLDAIPHWDYHLESSTKNNEADPLDGDFVIGRAFYRDLVKIAIDFSAGILISYLFFAHGASFLHFLESGILWGALGAMTPDFLQFVYTKTRKEPLISLQKFHMFIHAKLRLNDRPVLGPALQVGIVLLAGLLFS
jgi:hypothetical protein